MNQQRHADVVIVPDVVGKTVAEASGIAHEAGLSLAQPDPDGPPLAALTWPGVWLVTEQDPSPGTELYRWDSVRVRFRGAGADGSAGVREPRRPAPDPEGLAAERKSAGDPA
ncbi:PASTA domain-containing protein [Streptomyces sp. DvalAA-14]|uniref:PASTA domain-containing protein n=1 Tax=unclassified Streptomyces TaxID=2593676 RepID=UPI00081B65EC|nr:MULTISPECIES: PASTA domain-containing protein [unclassified Streptomyces]MYS23718.1 PASTA domain-containing protein [Streptomyces sp. SID4948]SCE37705.1 PASTA domain-containing protein [Streptomyces sp. DvalAA-14]